MRNILLFILFIPLFSCRSKNQSAETKQVTESPSIIGYDTSLQKGTVYKDIVCRNDNFTSYALYLPASYDTSRKFPVLYFFDAHADGLLPIEKYKELADKFGYVFIGNNNSKNGNSIEANAAYGEKMFEDSKQRMAIDINRIYVAGFSGGAKVAGYVAQHNIYVKGVISGGAAMPLSAPINGQQFFYIGIAGTEDFNYTDMKRQNDDMNSMSLQYELLTFDGRHEWAPVALLKKSLTGLELDAMRRKMIPVNQSLIDEFIKESNDEQVTLEKKGNLYELYNNYHRMLSFLNGLYNTSELQHKADALKNSPAYIKVQKAKSDAERKEADMKSQYVQLLQERDESWWAAEIKAINQRVKTDANKEEALAQKRILNYLSLAAFMYSNNAIGQGNTDAAIHFLNLYAIIDPPNPEHSYLLAEMYAKKELFDQSLSYLKEAANLGFKEKTRMEQDNYLVTLRTSPEFNRILEQVAANAEKK